MSTSPLSSPPPSASCWHAAFAAAPSVADITSSLASTSLAPSGGVAPSAVTHGESVVVITSPVSSSDSDPPLCGVVFGKWNKLCFRQNCTIQAHINAKKISPVTVAPGINVATSRS